MYQRVQRVECSSPRPVLLLGPLVEASKDLLVAESPTKFCRCLPGELSRTSLHPHSFLFDALTCWPVSVVGLIFVSLLCSRDNEGISAGHRAGSEGLRVHRLQTEEWPFRCDHRCVH